MQCKEWTGEDLTHLYLQERAAQLTTAQGEKMQRLAAVPGMLGPYAQAAPM